MTAGPRLDPDPLDAFDFVDEEWHEAVMTGYHAGRRARLATFILCALSGAVVGAAIAVILASAAYAASRSAVTSEPASRLHQPAPHASALAQPPPPAPVVKAPSAPALPPSAAIFRGVATWYCGSGSPCTRGYRPSDLVAAIDPTLGIAKGTRLTVTAGGRTVTVRVVDICACRGARIIDLTSGAFRRLAPLSRGTIRVALSTGGPLPTTPGTDTP